MTRSKNFVALATAFVALCLAAICFALMLLIPEEAKALQVVAVVASAVAGFILWWQAERDLDAVLSLVVVFAFGAALFLGVYMFTVGETGRTPKVAAVLAGTVGLTSLALTSRRQRSVSKDFPDLLRHEFSPDAIYETEGIQFAGRLVAGEGHSPHQMLVMLQNCFDAPRQVTILLDPAKLREYLRFQPTLCVELDACEVAIVAFPIITPTYPARYPLYLSVGVSGSGGRRVRLWRAQAATTRTSDAETLTLLLFGIIKFGGGIRFEVGPLPNDIWSQTPPVPRVATLWPEFRRTVAIS